MTDYLNPRSNEEKVSAYNKSVKERNVSRILVTSSLGNVFDGDELSQDRMIRAINIAKIDGDSSTYWKLADNTIVLVTLTELEEAVSLAGREMSLIWLT
jgi:hypothetical protein